MTPEKLPARLTLPTGRVVRLRASPGRPSPAAVAPAALFDEARTLLAAKVALLGDRGEPMEPGRLDLRDFHALRAILSRLGWLDEKAIDLVCTNCDAPMRVRPCSTFELGPFADAETGDPELDAPFDFDTVHDGVLLRRLTVDEVRPLHVALAKGPLDVTAKLVRALGVVAVDGHEGRTLTRLLRECDDETFGRVCDVFLDAHYSRRLFAAHVCRACGARNDVDAPWDRELAGETAFSRATAPAQGFPSFDELDAAARELAAPLLPADVVLVVEGGVPACDDAGVPLLGSYVPPFAGSELHPSRQAEVTVFYRTFRAEAQDFGPYDWRAELRETIEHELEHHAGALRGRDPMDEDERAEIARDIVRTVGKRELARRETRALFSDLGEFVRRTWPLWIVLLIAAIAMLIFGRSGN